MNFLLRLMGWVAKTSHYLSRQSVNLVPMNFLVIFLSGVFGFVGLGAAATEGKPEGILWGLPCSIICIAFVVSLVKRDTFFIGEALPTPAPVAGDNALDVPVRWTGRLRLTEKVAKRFIDMPATAARLDDGSFGVLSRIDASSRMYGVVTNSKSGVWLALPQPGGLEISAGTLYYGFRGTPSLRLQFTDSTDKKKSTAIISFDAPLARAAFYAWLEAERTQSGGKSFSTAPPIASPHSPFSNSTG